jgi:hypothetical protein
VNVHGAAFTGAKFVKICVEIGNGKLRAINDFLVDVARSKLIRYFGLLTEIKLSRDVKVIGSYCFADLTKIESLTFEHGSKLARIGRNAFSECVSLRSIVIPASVTEIAGGAFASSGICNVSVEEGNSCFCVSGKFLLGNAGTSLVAFFGIAATVAISREIEIICDSCFLGCKTMSRLTFEAGSRLRRIERFAFAECSSLHTICIPSSIECLEREWFLDSYFYRGAVFDTVQFESAESLEKMVIARSADLSGDFEIEVMNWNGEKPIPSYCVQTVISGNLVLLRKSTDSNE